MTSPFSGEDPFHGDSARDLAGHNKGVLQGRWIRGTDNAKIEGVVIQKQGTHVKTERDRLIEPAFWLDAHRIVDRLAGTGPCFYRGHYQGEKRGSGHGAGCFNRSRGNPG